MTLWPYARRLLWTGLVCATPSLLAAQGANRTGDSARILLLEHRFDPGVADTPVITLKQRVVYRAELIGPGGPVFQSAGSHRNAFLVPIPDSAGHASRWFEVYAIQAGPHTISLTGTPVGTTTRLRLYEDVAETRRLAEKHDRSLSIGLLFGAGVHSGYRLDPSGGDNPRSGGDAEACVFAETGNGLGTCVGAARQWFPNAGFAAIWLLIEQRVRVLSHLVGGRRADLGATLRLGHALYAGPRYESQYSTSPDLIAFGLYVTQHLATQGHRRGTSIFAAWQHGRLGGVIETERLDTNRFTLGITWLP